MYTTQSCSCNSILTTRSCSLVSRYHTQLALDTVCSPHIQQCTRFLYTPTTARHFLQTRASINECDHHVNISFLVIIHFRSRSNPPTIPGLAQSSFDLLTIHFLVMWIKWGHNWSTCRFIPHQSILKHQCGYMVKIGELVEHPSLSWLKIVVLYVTSRVLREAAMTTSGCSTFL